MKSRTYVAVAGFSGTDRLAAMELSNLLSKNGIDSMYEGSVIYDLLVPEQQKSIAEKILVEEGKRGLIWFICNGKSYSDETAEVLIYSDVMERRPRLVEDILKCKDLQSYFQGYLFVEAVHVKTKRIWVAPDRQEVAFDGRIDLRTSKGSNSGCRVYFQLWNDGQSGVFLGSNSWRQD
jgi:hypothetical protein